MQQGWYDWYHITLTAYGQWLPGDQRGWRTWKHHEHIAGDYHHRVAHNRAEGLWRSARSQMKQPPVVLISAHRTVVLNALVESAEIQQLSALCMAVVPSHAHLLLRCVSAMPKPCAGRAKRNATEKLRRRLMHFGRIPDEVREWPWCAEKGRPLWARGEHVEPIRDRDHLRGAHRYIMRHRNVGGAVWSAPAMVLAQWQISSPPQP